MKSLLIFFSLCQLTTSIGAQVPLKPEDISPLLIGEDIPDVTLKNLNGEDVDLKPLFRKKKTILLFYRGGWCPYCNVHLSEVSGEV